MFGVLLKFHFRLLRPVDVVARRFDDLVRPRNHLSVSQTDDTGSNKRRSIIRLKLSRLIDTVKYWL